MKEILDGDVALDRSGVGQGAGDSHSAQYRDNVHCARYGVIKTPHDHVGSGDQHHAQHGQPRHEGEYIYDRFEGGMVRVDNTLLHRLNTYSEAGAASAFLASAIMA